MKKLLLILSFISISCSTDEIAEERSQETTCYTILSRGTSQEGDFIIIKYSNYTQKKYAVSNYLDYLNETKLCEPITLTQLPL